MTEKQKRQGFFLVFGFKVSFKHGFKGCLIPQDLCVPQRLCFWYLSNFALMGCSLFAFYMYISMRKTEMWIWISYLCVSWLKWLIYDSYQNIGFWKWGLFDFVIGIIFIFQVLVFITAEINGFFLIFGNGVFCFCRWYRIYQVLKKIYIFL